MKQSQQSSSCATPRRTKRKAGLWLATIAFTTAAGAMLGDVYSGLLLGVLLGLPLISGGG
jgi:predicted lipid-binding transport protein (Tim44 family)